MAHLSPEELLDLAEGAGPREADHPHLAACDLCWRQLADLRSAMAAVSLTAGRDVPEPSPLFWEHLSSRVRDQIANEEPRAWSSRWPFTIKAIAWGRLGALSAVAAAAIVLAVMIGSRQPQSPAPSVGGRGSGAERIAAEPGAEVAAALVDDPSFGVVSDLADDMDVDTAMAAGLASEGSADHAVLHMTNPELLELQRLLKEGTSGSQKS